jgi:hypothetical protein
MFTRQHVTPQYHGTDGAPPPLHVAMPVPQQPPGLTREQLYGTGGLMGGAVLLNNATGNTGMKVGNTGYGYLGLDPSAPETWQTRQFNPQAGMIGRFHGR